MRNKETGEFELVVGNGQLVSGFFIVVLLFAVGVAMGYILGQNSEKSAKSQQTDAAPCVAADTRPQPASQPAQQPPLQSTAAADAQPPGGGDASQQPTTQPAKEPEPATSTQPAKPDPPKATPPPPKPAPADTPAATSDAPSGFFWQVTATANMNSARATVKTLQDKGFAAYLTPGPNRLTRVLVGPFKDTPSQAKAKADIEAMGLGTPVPLHRE